MAIFVLGMICSGACGVAFFQSQRRLIVPLKIIGAVLWILLARVGNFLLENQIDRAAQGEPSTFYTIYEQTLILVGTSFGLTLGGGMNLFQFLGIMAFQSVFFVTLPMWFIFDVLILVQEYFRNRDMPRSLIIELFGIAAALISFFQFLAD